MAIKNDLIGDYKILNNIFKNQQNIFIPFRIMGIMIEKEKE